MSYHGLGLDLAAAATDTLPPDVIAAGRLAGPYIGDVTGQLLSTAKGAIASRKVPALDVASGAKVVANSVVGATCGAAAVASGALAPAVAAGCGWLGKQMAKDLRPNFPWLDSGRQFIPEAQFFNQISKQSLAQCVPGDTACKSTVIKAIVWLTQGPESPLISNNAWALGYCQECETNWTQTKECKATHNPGCDVTWPYNPWGHFADIVAQSGAESHMRAEAAFAASIIEAAQASKPEFFKACDQLNPDARDACRQKADTAVDLLAMDTAEVLRRNGPEDGQRQWATSLANIRADIAGLAHSEQAAAQAQATANAAKKQAASALAAQKQAKLKAYLQETAASNAAEDKADRRRKAIGLGVLVVGLGVAGMMMFRGHK